MSRLGLHRTGSTAYRNYLRSPQWGFRRVRWFRECRKWGFEPVCQVCRKSLVDAGSLDLHHVSYEGVGWDEQRNQWIAAEQHTDLIPMCRNHHQQLHQMMDGRKEFYGWDRRRATVVIIRRLIDRFTRNIEGTQP